jgi:hypothetical protein
LAGEERPVITKVRQAAADLASTTRQSLDLRR